MVFRCIWDNRYGLVELNINQTVVVQFYKVLKVATLPRLAAQMYDIYFIMMTTAYVNLDGSLKTPLRHGYKPGWASEDTSEASTATAIKVSQF